ncbi:MAG: WD40/YVTN/BNR-like repeat-containing protein [Gemmatimonadaceae bacterium]
MSPRHASFAAAVLVSVAALSLSAQQAATRRAATPAMRATPAAAPTAAPAAEPWNALHWRNIGPEGNRFSAAAGIPGDPLTYYVGAASGGVWKTTDGGTNWRPLFDGQIVQSIGSIAVARSDKNVIWVGTGEGKIRSHISIGQGVYKSTDAGDTWTLM